MESARDAGLARRQSMAEAKSQMVGRPRRARVPACAPNVTSPARGRRGRDQVPHRTFQGNFAVACWPAYAPAVLDRAALKMRRQRTGVHNQTLVLLRQSITAYTLSIERERRMKSFSRSAVPKFVEFAASKGLIAQSTSRMWRAALNAILEDVADDFDVRAVDLDAELAKYHNRHPNSLSPETLRRYRGWADTAIKAFVTYTEDPVSYRPKSRASPGRGAADAGKPEKPKTRDIKQPTLEHGGTNPLAQAAEQSANAHTQVAPSLSLQFPIRADFRAQVVIPADITLNEAKRLGAFLLTLAQDYIPD